MQTHCACSSRRRTEMRYLQSFLLMLLPCLPAAMPAMAAAGDADAVAIATRLLDHMQAGEYAAATADFTAQMKRGLGADNPATVQAQLAPPGADTRRVPPSSSQPSAMPH